MPVGQFTPVPLSTHHLFKNLVGRRFGLLIVEAYGGPDASKRARWICRCDCGNTSLVGVSNLRPGGTQSCGCRQGTGRKPKPPRPHRAEWQIYRAMKKRCYDSNQDSYPEYGGRGIVICDRWLSSFNAFVEDMGPRPSPRHSIDRIDNDGPYSPENCRWATPKDQARNRRDNRLLTKDGVTRTVIEWAEILAIRKRLWGDRP